MWKFFLLRDVLFSTIQNNSFLQWLFLSKVNTKFVIQPGMNGEREYFADGFQNKSM